MSREFRNRIRPSQQEEYVEFSEKSGRYNRHNKVVDPRIRQLEVILENPLQVNIVASRLGWRGSPQSIDQIAERNALSRAEVEELLANGFKTISDLLQKPTDLT